MPSNDPIHQMLIDQGKMNDPDPPEPAEAIPSISSNLPDLVDNYITTRAQRLVLAKEVTELEETEKELYRTIVAKFRDQKITALGGKMGILKMAETIEPNAEDWLQIWEHIKATGDFELLHKRLTVTAVKERWDDGVEVPGVGRVPKYTLTVSKPPRSSNG